jgi:hypothetical protein
VGSGGNILQIEDNIMSLDQFIKMYLDYVNNFISIGAFADHYGITQNEAVDIIELGYQIRNMEINIGHTHR